ncbi:hypothetical protein K7432_001898 [Basidiobolus ranarum]|uniref:Prefoldin subunit 3 n=1 Tax=Basidiobolus ranarum TaxID=34480 RepID=A0ABR2W8U1_9FUNG
METNPRGIPKAPFIENVDEYISEENTTEVTLRKFQEAVSKYKFMEVNLLQKKKSLEMKIPELKKTLDVIELLLEKKDSDEPLETQFELHETLYANAKIPITDKVNLWLGANVMLEYSVEEAQELISSKLITAKSSLEQANEDALFLRDQITTMEVNIARVYNWDVKQRRGTKEKSDQ